ncbi:MAG: redoxin domain-containing protein [Anaerolineae bacterium]
MLAIGQLAPDFTLKDQRGNDVTLSDLRGQKVVLSFHPLAWTSVCTLQMQDLEARRNEWQRLGAVALGLSVDSQPCKKAWAEAIGVVHTPLLADFWPHGAVAQACDVFRPRHGTSERAVLILDAEGVVRWTKLYPVAERPDIDEVVAACAR